MSRLLKGKEHFFRFRHPSLRNLALYNHLISLASNIQENSKHEVWYNYGVCVCFEEMTIWRFGRAFCRLSLWPFIELNLPKTLHAVVFIDDPGLIAFTNNADYSKVQRPIIFPSRL